MAYGVRPHKSPPAVNPKSLMAVLRGVAREAQAEHVQLESLTEIVTTQPAIEEGYTLDVDIVEAVKSLPGYLQPVVTIMAIMVPSSEESKMWDKRGREALAQATSMMLMVSTPSTFEICVKCLPVVFVSNNLFLFLVRVP